jgi:hypothetical protein
MQLFCPLDPSPIRYLTSYKITASLTSDKIERKCPLMIFYLQKTLKSRVYKFKKLSDTLSNHPTPNNPMTQCDVLFKRHIKQGIQTHIPRAACGPPDVFVRPATSLK